MNKNTNHMHCVLRSTINSIITVSFLTNLNVYINVLSGSPRWSSQRSSLSIR